MGKSHRDSAVGSVWQSDFRFVATADNLLS